MVLLVFASRRASYGAELAQLCRSTATHTLAIAKRRFFPDYPNGI